MIHAPPAYPISHLPTFGMRCTVTQTAATVTNVPTDVVKISTGVVQMPSVISDVQNIELKSSYVQPYTKFIKIFEICKQFSENIVNEFGNQCQG